MKKSILKTFSAFTAALCLFGTAAAAYGQSFSITANAADLQKSGVIDGYQYEIWNGDNTGDVVYENTDNNGFYVEWSNIRDCMASKSKNFEASTISAYQIQDYKIDYDLDICSDGPCFVGVKVWMTGSQKSLDTYEAWCGAPTVMSSDTKVADATANSTDCDIYIHHTAADINLTPSYFSVPQKEPFETDKESHFQGTIDVAAHLRALSEAGVNLGNLYLVQFYVEGYCCNGHARLNSLDTRYDIADEAVFGPSAGATSYKKHDPLPVGDDGSIINVDFETGFDKTGVTGSDSDAVLTEEHSYSGAHSMYVASSAENSGAFFYELDPYDLPSPPDDILYPYKAEAKILHTAGHDVDFNVYLCTYSNDPDNGNGRLIGKASCRSGKWTAIKYAFFDFDYNTLKKYRIVIEPSDPDEAVDYCVDDFSIAVANKSSTAVYPFESSVRGDLNNDGKVNSLDIIVCRRAVIDALDNNQIIIPEGDVNGDFMSNISDLVMLTKYVLDIPDSTAVSGNDSVMYPGDLFLEKEQCTYSISNNSQVIDDSLKTIMRKDGSFLTEWKESECHSKLQYTFHDTRISTKNFDINYTADMNVSGDASIDISIDSTNGTRLNIIEGWVDSIVIGNSQYENPNVISLNGTEYYVDVYSYKNIYIYRKDNPLVLNENSRIENSFNIEELLDLLPEYIEKNDFIVNEVKIEFKANGSGHADFSEYSIGGKTIND